MIPSLKKTHKILLSKILSVFIAIILISSVAIPILGYDKPVLAQTTSGIVYVTAQCCDGSIVVESSAINGGQQVVVPSGGEVGPYTIPSGTSVSLTANPTSGNYFSMWTGEINGNGCPLSNGFAICGSSSPLTFTVTSGTTSITGSFISSPPQLTPTTTSVSSSANPSTSGQPVAFTATVFPVLNGGTVQFQIDGVNYGSPVTVISGSATSTIISTLAGGSHTINAMYSGTTNFANSSGTLTQEVNQSTQPGGANTGTVPVTFTETGLPQGTSWSITLNGNTQSSTSTSITFNEPNGNYQFVVNPPVSYNVVSYSGSLTVNSSPLSQALTFVPPVQESGSTPVSMSLTGTVSGPMTNLQMTLTSGTITAGGTTYPVTGSPGQFCNQNNVVCNSPNGVLSAGFIQLPSGLVLGLASCYTQVNNNQLQLSFYNGRPNTCGGTTAIVQPPTNAFYCPFNATGTLTVSGSQATITASGTGNCNIPTSQTPTTTSVSSSQNPSATGQSVSFSAVISPIPDGGTVQFLVDGIPIGNPVSVSGGQTTYSTSSLSIGTHQIIASYSGDTKFLSSISHTINQIINPSTIVITNTQFPSQVYQGQEFTVYLDVSNQGSVSVNPNLYLSLDSQSTIPTVDALGNQPQILCSPAGGVSIPPNGQETISFQCVANWSFSAPPSFVSTTLGALLSLGTTALSDSNLLTFVKAYSLYPNLLVQITNAANISTQAVQDVGTDIGLLQLINHGAVTPIVQYNLRLYTNSHVVQINPSMQPIQIVINGSPAKISAMWDYAGIEVSSPAVSGGLVLAGTVAFGTCAFTFGVGCILAGTLYATAALEGSALPAYYQKQMSDPSSNYTQFVSPEQPSSLILSLNNSTVGHALYNLALYDSYLNASAISNARAYGAIQNNSTYYAYMQGSKAEQYANDASTYFQQFKLYLGESLQELNSTGSLNQTEFNNAKLTLSKQGLPQDITQILSALHLSGNINMTQLENLQYKPVNMTLIQSIQNGGSDLSQQDKNYLKNLSNTVLSNGPTLNIISPHDGSILNHNTFYVSGTTNDTAGIQKVRISVDGNQPSSATLNFGSYVNSTVSWVYTTPTLLDGSHVLIVNSTSDDGKSSLVSILVTVDTIPPEAYLEFNSTTKDVTLYGNDSLSGIPNNPILPISVASAKWGDDDNKLDNDADKGDAQIRTYDITDRSGNTLVLIEKVRTSGHEDKVRILSLQYNNGKVIYTLPNEAKFSWSENKDHSIKELEQHITTGKDKNKQDIDAKYSFKDNKTAIHVEIPSKHNKDIKEPGLVLLHIATNNGTLTVNGY